MVSIFALCSSLKTLELSGFNTSKVQHMSYMFSGCSSLKNLDLSSFTAATNLQDVDGMFKNCTNLEKVNLEKFSCGKYTSGKDSMFENCKLLLTKIFLEIENQQPSENGQPKKNDAILEQSKVPKIEEKQTLKNVDSSNLVNNNKLNIDFEFKDNSVPTNNNENNKEIYNKSDNELENSKKNTDEKECKCPCTIF